MRRTPLLASCLRAAGEVWGHSVVCVPPNSLYGQWCLGCAVRQACTTTAAPPSPVRSPLFPPPPALPRRVLRWQVPPGAAFFTDAPVRVDSGVVQGDTVSGS
jgi:hypothetical protein